MLKVQEVNASQPRDWNPTPRVLAQLRAAVNREAYPPARRSGVGPATGPAR
ncbi:MAG: hypothetical protein ABW022_03200 [Actinoplanes sp.]